MKPSKLFGDPDSCETKYEWQLEAIIQFFLADFSLPPRFWNAAKCSHFVFSHHVLLQSSEALRQGKKFFHMNHLWSKKDKAAWPISAGLSVRLKGFWSWGLWERPKYHQMSRVCWRVLGQPSKTFWKQPDIALLLCTRKALLWRRGFCSRSLLGVDFSWEIRPEGSKRSAAKETFKKGVSQYAAGNARERYCKLTGMTVQWVRCSVALFSIEIDYVSNCKQAIASYSCMIATFASSKPFFWWNHDINLLLSEKETKKIVQRWSCVHLQSFRLKSSRQKMGVPRCTAQIQINWTWPCTMWDWEIWRGA